MGSIQKRDKARWRARYRGPDGRERSRTFPRKTEAEKFLAGIETALARGEWLDPARGSMKVDEWARAWMPTLTDLRPTTRQRLAGIVELHVLPEFGHRKLSSLSNAEIREWAGRMTKTGKGATTVRKSVFALRRMLDAAIADRRLTFNAAQNVPLPAEKSTEQRFLSQAEVEALAEAIDPKYRAMVLLGAFGGLRWGEMAGLRRDRVDVLRSKITISETAVEVAGHVTFGEPKTPKSRRTVPIARTVMRELEQHLANNVGPEADALVFTAPQGGPMYRGTFARSVWKPATKSADLAGLRIHDLRHSFVAIMTAAGANPKEVSTWAGHSSVAFTLDRYGHLYDDHSDDVADRIDAMLASSRSASGNVRSLR